MKKLLHLLPFIAVALASCSAPQGMTVKQYESLVNQPAGTAANAPAMLQLSIEAPGKPAADLGTGALKPGREMEFQSGKEFIYPTHYDWAKRGKADAPGTIYPATPDQFKVANTGTIAHLTAERQGGLVVIKGSIEVTDFQGFSKMGGELGQPLLDEKGRLITENRVAMPKFATYTTPVYVAIQPGKPCTFEISHPVKGTKAVLNVAPKS